jgi:hypothetical protein
VTNTTLLRDRLLDRMASMGEPFDYGRLASDVLGIRGAPPDLARRLVMQALVIEDRRESWRQVGERICQGAPASPGVYVLRDAAGAPLYVGKAVNVRRRLRSHFAPGRWRRLKPMLARVASAQWDEVGSELEALLREAALIRELQPPVNVQVGPPSLGKRAIARAVVRDVVAILPSADSACVELIAARTRGDVVVLRTPRDGASLEDAVSRLWTFFVRDAPTPPADPGSSAALVFSWLAGRGAATTRVDPYQWGSASALRDRISTLLRDELLFRERLVVV